jgi:rSAM/selenodomain-associated transferase 1
MRARRRPSVVVFVRAPRRGAVKRRLADGIGASAAHRFYVETTKAVLDRLVDPRWSLSLAVTPDTFARSGRFWPRRIARIPQGAGDLGARMERALLSSGGPSVIVGSDIPDLGAAHVRRALAALATHDVVFGPAQDGGYWLVGVKRPAMARGLFRGVRWSGPHSLADTRAHVPRHLRAALVDVLADVDDRAAWERWRALRPGPS